jgi:ABC-type multidrug transport system ATPase subunit
LQNLTLTWDYINVYKSETKKGLFKKSIKTNEKRLLQNVEGIARPGELLAIMGASGAGKTTLLNVLNCRSSRDLTVNGAVRINGNLIRQASDIALVSSYVQQDDIFIGTLKVKEHLMFQAILRMDKCHTKAQKEKRVKEVLNDVKFA